MILVLAVLGLHCCPGLLQLAGWGSSLAGARRRLAAAASLGAELGLQAPGLGAAAPGPWDTRLYLWCTWAWLLLGTWGLSGPAVKSVSPALVGGFLTTRLSNNIFKNQN